MSRKTVSAVIGSLLVAGFVLGAVQGCGSSSSSAANVMSLCMQGCVKIVKCGADAGSSETMAECMQGCVSSETTSTGGACSNQSAIIEAGNACLAKTTCVELEACALTVQPCEGAGTGGVSGTGTGGATGGTSGATGGANGATGGTSGATGGTSGAAGGSGAASCSSCDKAQTCCVAAESFGIPASDCTFSATKCNGMSGSNQTAYVTMCQEILAEGAQYSVAACQ
jgi:hypothetical protein